MTVPADPSTPLTVVISGLRVLHQRVELCRHWGAVGAYAPSDFGRFHHDIRASGARGRPLDVWASEQGFSVTASDGEDVALTYEVDTLAGERELDDFMVSTHRRVGYALISGYATYVVAEGSEDRPHRVCFDLPAEWRIETALRADGPSCFVASSGFELLDEPVVAGTAFHTRRVEPIETGGESTFVHVYVEGSSEHTTQLDIITAATADAVRALSALDLPPLGRPMHVFYEHFSHDLGRDLGWALEHGASMHGASFVDENLEPRATLTYHVAHHLLHAWTPRRLYTTDLAPAHLLRGGESEFIWFAEGWVQYLTFVALGRSGVLSVDQVVNMLSRRFLRAAVHGRPDEPISMMALSRVLSRGEHEHWFYGFSVGALLALWLDVRLARDPNVEVDMVEVHRRLFEAMERSPGGLDGSRFPELFAELSGHDASEIFARYVSGDEPLPVDDIIGALGLGWDRENRSMYPDRSTIVETEPMRTRLFGAR